jgi:RNA polymerase sigma factor for flagellar operon FliA
VQSDTWAARSASATGGLDEEAKAALWQKFWAARDREYRNELILAYQSLVFAVTARLPIRVRANWELCDLQSFGILGLIEAIDRFDEESEPSRFASYAMKRIRGAIYDELRRLDWLPRTIRRRVITYQTTADELSNELGRVPETKEVLTSMGVEAGASNSIRQELHSAQLVHLQQGESTEEWSAGYRLIEQLVSDRDKEPEPKFLHAERLEELRAAVKQLPERQRTVITLHLLGGVTQEQVGVVLGVSNSRVCQIEAAAVQALRTMLADAPEGRSTMRAG